MSILHQPSDLCEFRGSTSQHAKNPKVPHIAESMLAVVLFLCFTGTGCTSIKLPTNPFAHPGSELGDYTGMEGVPALPASESEKVYRGVQEARATGGVILHVPGDKESVRVLPLPSDGRSVYVSSLLKQTGVQKKMGSIQATLFRHSTASITGIPLECRMSRDGESVRPECDYALQPGDRLTVEKANNPAIQALLDGLLGR